MLTEREISEGKAIIARQIADGRITVITPHHKAVFVNEMERIEHRRQLTLERVRRYRRRHHP